MPKQNAEEIVRPGAPTSGDRIIQICILVVGILSIIVMIGLAHLPASRVSRVRAKVLLPKGMSREGYEFKFRQMDPVPTNIWGEAILPAEIRGQRGELSEPDGEPILEVDAPEMGDLTVDLRATNPERSRRVSPSAIPSD